MDLFRKNRKKDAYSGSNVLLFRALAALYLAYLTSSLVKAFINGESSMQTWLQLLLIVAFALITVALAVWTLKVFFLLRRKKESEDEKKEPKESGQAGE